MTRQAGMTDSLLEYEVDLDGSVSCMAFVLFDVEGSVVLLKAH